MAATEHAVEIGVRTGLPPRRENDSDSDRRTKRIGLTESKRAAIVQIGQTYRRAVEAFVGQLDAANAPPAMRPSPLWAN